MICLLNARKCSWPFDKNKYQINDESTNTDNFQSNSNRFLWIGGSFFWWPIGWIIESCYFVLGTQFLVFPHWFGVIFDGSSLANSPRLIISRNKNENIFRSHLCYCFLGMCCVYLYLASSLFLFVQFSWDTWKLIVFLYIKVATIVWFHQKPQKFFQKWWTISAMKMWNGFNVVENGNTNFDKQNSTIRFDLSSSIQFSLLLCVCVVRFACMCVICRLSVVKCRIYSQMYAIRNK